MAKTKQESKPDAGATAVKGTGEGGAGYRHPPLLAMFYSAVLASVDWQRDVRRWPTICRDAMKIARLAHEEYQQADKQDGNT